MIFMNKQLFVYNEINKDTQVKAEEFIALIIHLGLKFRGEI